MSPESGGVQRAESPLPAVWVSAGTSTRLGGEAPWTAADRVLCQVRVLYVVSFPWATGKAGNRKWDGKRNRNRKLEQEMGWEEKQEQETGTGMGVTQYKAGTVCNHWTGVLNFTQTAIKSLGLCRNCSLCLFPQFRPLLTREDTWNSIG